MTVKIDFNKTGLTITMGYLNSFWGFRRKIDVPYHSILKVRPLQESSAYKGIRTFGVNIPGVLSVGTFRNVTRAQKEYWNVSSQPEKKSIEIFLKDHEFARLVIETPEREKIIANILGRVGDPKNVSGNSEILSENLSIDVGDRQVEATFSYPKDSYADKKIPAVLMLAGSGPTDRDWVSKKVPGMNGSGALLAEDLGKFGFASLRFDKLGSGKSKISGEVSWDKYYAEQKAALERLHTCHCVDTENVFVMGHSEGALHAIKLAQREVASLRGLILLAPPGRTMPEVLETQISQQLSMFLSQKKVDLEMSKLQAGFRSIIEHKPIPADQLKLNFLTRKVYDLFVNPAVLSYSSSFLQFDPVAELSKVKIPTLIVGAEKDQQVDPEKDIMHLYRSVSAKKSNLALQIFPNADHVFKFEPTPQAKLSKIAGLAYNFDNRFLFTGVASFLTTWCRAQMASGAMPKDENLNSDKPSGYTH